ncbi:gustatory receptor for sugar taste 64e-like isoform X2 [Athalia rosae]|uniref:gustatory receptor for sugar taste 64e-like isoform X2 n=1 Tax=Athalia rosae TaxID=37344 RepID=UPI002033EE26|nr:gustatory receptor for sugar taste 64e-like isoform X2 [Athalia rosae]
MSIFYPTRKQLDYFTHLQHNIQPLHSNVNICVLYPRAVCERIQQKAHVEQSGKMTVTRSDYMRRVDDPIKGSGTPCKGVGSGSRKIWPLLSRKVISSSKQCRPYRIGSQSRSRFLLGTSAGVIERQNVPQQLCQDPESFHCAIGRILAVAQWFGLLPVFGVLLPSYKGLTFRKISFRTFYAIVLAASMLFVTSSSVIHMIRSIYSKSFDIKGGIASATAGVIFYGNSVLGASIFLWLAPRWGPLQHEWQAMEQLTDRWGRPRLRMKFSILTGIILLSAMIEHILSMINNTPNYHWGNSTNASFESYLDEYTHKSHAFILSTWDYNIVLGIFLFTISKIATFTWNFTDLFLMLVATGLAERFKTLNKRMTSRNAAMPTIGEWKILRESYAALSALVKRVDNDVSPIVLLSFVNNLYFICLQLLNGLSPEGEAVLSTVYFFGSFIFLVARTIGVTLLASRINDQSRIALPILYTCPAKTYCIETQRLEHQLATDDVALSGLRFFFITRSFLLAVAGAIVTYEVILLQFNLAMNQDGE